MLMFPLHADVDPDLHLPRQAAAVIVSGRWRFCGPERGQVLRGASRAFPSWVNGDARCTVPPSCGLRDSSA